MTTLIVTLLGLFCFFAAGAAITALARLTGQERQGSISSAERIWILHHERHRP
jgi:hypothetical protein